jgi:hypothetical protein
VLVLASAEAVTGITVAGALAVALITAFTTNRRQRESLNHDRELADLADLRALLDEAAVAFERSYDMFDNLVKRFGEHGEDLPGEHRSNLADAGRVMLALKARLHVRLGENSPITTPFDLGVHEMSMTWHDLHPENLEQASEADLSEMLTKMEDSKGRFVEARTSFGKAAVARAGTVETHLQN